MAPLLFVEILLLLGVCPLPLSLSQPAIALSVECTTDTMDCPDGSVVARDPTMDCAFRSCDNNTTTTTAGCPRDVHACPDGSFVSRDANTTACAFSPCPTSISSAAAGCARDMKTCPDGSFVIRDPEKGCQFLPCPLQEISQLCTADVHECGDGSFVRRDPANDCQFLLCPLQEFTTKLCAADVQECSDSSFVSRDPENGCQFSPCPDDGILSCTADVQECSDGSFVSRDSRNGCQFPPCPVCCSLADRPQFNTEEPICCPDGSWAGNIGDGSAHCGADGLVSESGPVCSPDCDVCPCGFNNGCNDCACIDDELFGVIAGCTKRFCSTLHSTEPSCLECPTKPPPTLKAEITCEDCPCGFFDGCNTCGCTEGDDGELATVCTLRACSIDDLEESRCNSCPLPVVPLPTSPNDSTIVEVSCEDCPCGYYDGCNNCGCDDQGSPFCTELACGIDDLDESRCHVCPSRTEDPLVSCDRCPCGYFDGCNQCHCEDDGGAFCTEIFCSETVGTPQCNKCPDDPMPCQKDARVCLDGTFVYRVAADGCSFESCPCNNVFCRLAQLFRTVFSFFRRLRN